MMPVIEVDFLIWNAARLPDRHWRVVALKIVIWSSFEIFLLSLMSPLRGLVFQPLFHLLKKITVLLASCYGIHYEMASYGKFHNANIFVTFVNV